MIEALAQLVVMAPPEAVSWGGSTDAGMDLLHSEGRSVGMPEGRPTEGV